MKVKNLSLLFLLLLLASGGLFSAEKSRRKPLVVFFVRHAEKVDSSRNAQLSNDGHARAKELVRVLKDAELTHVHSTDFARTTATAKPVANHCGLQVELYDPYNAQALIQQLRATDGRHLVVGHSSSISGAIRLLGGNPGSRINYTDEFDRLYVVSVDSMGHANTVLLRYGRATKTE